MTLLPVAYRELRAASRRKGTFRMRIGTAGLAVGVTFLMLLFVSVTGLGRQGGENVFQGLVVGAHVFAALTGILLTADSIGEERRDGTLGLLFLTDLGGLDVIAGKFAGLVVNAFYGLAAVFPVMAISWFMGGIGNGEFWRNCIVLLNHLFFASALGLAVSSLVQSQARAVGICLGAMALVDIGGPLAGLATAAFPQAAPVEPLLGIAPTRAWGFAGSTSYDLGPSRFWSALATCHVTSWVLLGVAVVSLNQGWRRSGRQAETSARRPLNRGLLESQPLRALIARGAFPGRAIVIAALAALLLCILGVWGAVDRFFVHLGIGTITLCVQGLAVWEVTTFLAEGRRTGGLEMLLATPLRDRDINSAVHRHLTARYLGPLFALVLLDYVACVHAGQAELALIGSLGTLSQMLCIGTISLWFALSEPRPMVAFGKAFGFGVLLPTPLGYMCCVGLVIPPLLLAWTSSKLRLPYRDIVAGIRSHWQRREGWMHATDNSSPTRQSPPPLPFGRSDRP